MQLIDNEILIWDDIKSQYPDEWVVIGAGENRRQWGDYRTDAKVSK